MKSITCPHCQKMVNIEGTGVTAEIRTYARNYMTDHPNAKVDEVVKAYLMTNPAANVSTVMTQVRAAR